MKRSIVTLFIILLILLQPACVNTDSKKKEYGKATKDLIELLDKNPEIKSLLIASIEKARQINPDLFPAPKHPCPGLYYINLNTLIFLTIPFRVFAISSS